MARNFRSVNWFRFVVILGLSLIASLTIAFGDEYLSSAEFINGILQMSLAGFAYLQCPEDFHK